MRPQVPLIPPCSIFGHTALDQAAPSHGAVDHAAPWCHTMPHLPVPVHLPCLVSTCDIHMQKPTKTNTASSGVCAQEGCHGERVPLPPDIMPAQPHRPGYQEGESVGAGMTDSQRALTLARCWHKWRDACPRPRLSCGRVEHVKPCGCGPFTSHHPITPPHQTAPNCHTTPPTRCVCTQVSAGPAAERLRALYQQKVQEAEETVGWL